MRWLGILKQATSAVQCKLKSSVPATVNSVCTNPLYQLHRHILHHRHPSLLTQLRYLTSGKGGSEKPPFDIGDLEDDTYGSSITSRASGNQDLDHGGHRPRHSGFQNRRPRAQNYDDYDDYDGYNRPRPSGFQNRRPRAQNYDDYDDYGGYSSRRDSFQNRRTRSYNDDFGNDFEPSDSGRGYGGGRHGNDFGRPNRHANNNQEFGYNLKKKEWSSQQLAPVEKNFYVEHESVAALSESDLESFYAEHKISVTRGEQLKPVLDFHHANFPDRINKYMEGLSWSKPTCIQSVGWPLALSGRNMVAIAQTGSGKTLGFILPALIHIRHQRQVMRGEGPVALVLAPTRELAQQIQSVAQEYGRLLGINSLAVYGGASKMSQARSLSRSPELVVATPGRLLDLLECEVLSLDRCTYTVLDEADRMLDMGFEPQIRKILSQIRPDRQMLMWSATWPEEIQQLAHDFLGDFSQVNIGSSELSANPDIQQVVHVCERGRKISEMLKVIHDNMTEDDEVPKTLIFVASKVSADFISQKLRKSRFRAESIHGDKSQKLRDITLRRFREGRTEILVATDVAARGLDVDDIKMVINLDFPNTTDDYVHRIGRTGRAGRQGLAHTFVADDGSTSAKNLRGLIKIMQDNDQHVSEDLEDLARMASRLSKPKQKGGRDKRQAPRHGGWRRRESWSRNDDDGWW